MNFELILGILIAIMGATFALWVVVRWAKSKDDDWPSATDLQKMEEDWLRWKSRRNADVE